MFLAPSYAVAIKRGRDLIAKFKDRYPAAMECLEKDLEECVTHLRFPDAHHRRLRTTNRLEGLNGKGRRRTKVIPRSPKERSRLTLLYARPHGHLETVARDSDDRRDASSARPTARRGDAGAEGSGGVV